jgi:hypothetical protein
MPFAQLSLCLELTVPDNHRQRGVVVIVEGFLRWPAEYGGDQRRQDQSNPRVLHDC